MPKVTALMPLYNGITYIKESLESVQAQTFKDWEFIIVNDYGSDDGCADIVRSYAEKDSRIKLVQTEKRLGLAASLNLGLDMAQGEYVARVDVDDPSKPERFAKQIAFMDTHPEICLCSCWMTTLTPKESHLEKMAVGSDRIRATSMFGCQVCHAGAMLRKTVFDKNNWRYNPAYLSEDHELWTRVQSEGGKIENIPETLVMHRWGFGGVTMSKGERLRQEVRQINKRAVETFGVDCSKYDDYLFSGWNHRPEKYAKSNVSSFLRQNHNLITEIIKANAQKGNVEPDVIKKLAIDRWNWARRCCGLSPSATFTKNSLDEIKQSTPRAKRRHPMKKLLMPLAHLSRRVVRELMKDVIADVDKRIESWTWERLQRLLCKCGEDSLKIRYCPEQKIRVAFIVQVASFWPAQEEVYRQMKTDGRFEVRLVCYDDNFDKSIKTATTEQYLHENGYDYVSWKKFSLSDFNPHVVFVQTAYDSNRNGEYKSLNIRGYGSRLVYIPYGIEIADTLHARRDHFSGAVVSNAWKIYTFSEEMRKEYNIHVHSNADIVATGLPRFDALYHKERFHQHTAVQNQANRRKIVLWKVHFPKVIKQLDETILVTPDIKEYIRFAESVESYSDLFFVFMPHPRFREFNADPTVQQQTKELMEILGKMSNVYIDEADDYRPSLLNADCIIIDRSAVMIEAGAIGVPVLYMSNADYYEPMTAAVMPLVESYYQGNSAQDMKSFLERFQKGEDPNKEKREAAFRQCIPFFDGKCAERIKEDIVLSLEAERESSVGAQLQRQTAQLEERLNHLEAQIQRRSEEQERQLCKEIERWTWDRYKRTKNELVSQTFELLHHDNPKKMQDLMSRSPTYDFAFYLDNRFGSIESAQHVLYTVFQFLPHKSVVDFGCGSGTWLWVAQAFGAQDVLGLDGEYVPDGMRMLHGGQFMPCDLERRQELQKKYDLAMSLEVAEHLSRESAAVFVESLCAASDIVLFSAAHPGQGGDGHINEQPVEYWIEKFAVHGYEPIQIQHLFSTDQHIKKWYKDNIILFVTGQICQDIKDAMERVRVGG